MKINLDILMDISLLVMALSGIASILFAVSEYRLISTVMFIITMISGIIFFLTGLEISKRL